MQRKKLNIALILFLVIRFALPAYGEATGDETYSFEFRGEPLEEVLNYVAQETNTDLIYDQNLVQDEAVYVRIEEKKVPDILSEILEDTRLDYLTLSTGTIVIVETVSDDPAYGTFTGKVKDSRTGEPLSGATVKLVDASGGTSTNRSGNFSLNRMMSGTYRILFSYVGYETVEKEIEIKPDGHTAEEVNLQPEPVDFSPVIVTGNRPNLAGIQQGNPHETRSEWHLADEQFDVIRSLSLYSGVQYGLPMQDLHLQGGQTGEHRMRLDGVPMYNPYSFGQLFSAFSPMAIGDIQLHKAGYGVEEGSQIAGIVELNHESAAEGENRGYLQGDPLTINLRGDLSSSDDSSYNIMGAFRTNYWDVYQDPVLEQSLQEWDYVDPLISNQFVPSEMDLSEFRPTQQESSVSFADLHLSGRFEINDHNTLGASAYYGHNNVGSAHLAEAPPQTDYPPYFHAGEEYDWTNIMGQLSWDTQVNPRLHLTSQLAYSTSRMNHNYRMIIDEQEEVAAFAMSDQLAAFERAGVDPENFMQTGDNMIEHLLLRVDGDYSFNPRFSIDGGADVNLVASEVDFSEFFFLPTRIRQNSLISAFYLNANRQLGDNWEVKAGSRFTYTNSHEQIYAEPRASVQYDRADSPIGYWAGRVSGGLYRQFINQYEISTIGPTSVVPSLQVWSHAMTSEIPKAYHLSGSWFNQPASGTTIELEAYHKWQPTGYITSYENLIRGVTVERDSPEAFMETSAMRSYGAGVRLNQKMFDSRVNLMFGYDYNISKVEKGSPFNREVSAPWNEPHRIQARTLLRPLENFSAVVKWQSLLGRDWGFRQSYYDYLPFRDVTRTGDYSFLDPENDRLSPFHQLDVSLIYRPSIGFANLDLRLDLINILNRRNTVDWSLQHEVPAEDFDLTTGVIEGYETRERKMPGFYPTFSVEFNF